MMETRRIDLFVGRSASIVGIVYVALARLRPFTAERRTKRGVTGAVVRCPERSRLRGAAIVAAVCVAALVAALFLTIHAIAAGPDDWRLPLASAVTGPY